MGSEKLVCGIGENDLYCRVSVKGKAKKFYQVWIGMLHRCYNKATQQKQPTYIGCSVCDEWKKLSNFKRWYDSHNIEGWQIDKDLLVKGNRIYSPQTCVMLPSEINSFLSLVRERKRKDLPQGVNEYKGMYTTGVGDFNCCGYFSTIEEAREVYKQMRECKAKMLALKYKPLLEPRAFNALMNYSLD